MFNFAVGRESLLSGFQWFFFIFCNTVVVPPTLLSAFQLPQSSLLTLTQYAFLATALACFAQAFCGHRRAIMEGPGGLASLLRRKVNLSLNISSNLALQCPSLWRAFSG